MDLGLKGKRALVTGASQGIGRACAESLAREGCDLELAARQSERLDAARAELSRHGIRVAVHPVDLAQPDAAAKLARDCTSVDILINNAGSTPRGSLLELDEPAWRSGWELKVFGYLNLTREFYRRMVERRSGVIVNVIGIAGEKLEYAYAAGSTGNAALIAMTRAVGSASLDYGVRVLGVNPGWVETERSKRSLRRRAEQELGDAERWRELVKHWPRGHLLRPEEVADVVAFAASERASALCGVVSDVDAGFAAQGYPRSPEARA